MARMYESRVPSLEEKLRLKAAAYKKSPMVEKEAKVKKAKAKK